MPISHWFRKTDDLIAETESEIAHYERQLATGKPSPSRVKDAYLSKEDLESLLSGLRKKLESLKK